MLFDGVPEMPRLEAASGCKTVRVEGPVDASLSVAHRRPNILVIRGDIAWQREFVARIQSRARPVIFVFGGGSEACAVGDEWLATPPGPSEALIRLRRAMARAQERKRLNRRALTDALTGLPNRRALIWALVSEATRARHSTSQLALVLIDLDHFKQVNEQQGHAGGDRLLRQVGASLRRLTRAGEVCGRIGGDEFALVVSGEISAAESAIQRIRLGLQAIGVSATFSHAVLHRNERLRAFYRRTDALLFSAKALRDLRRPTQFDVPAAHVIAGSSTTSAWRPRQFTKEAVNVLGMQ